MADEALTLAKKKSKQRTFPIGICMLVDGVWRPIYSVEVDEETAQLTVRAGIMTMNLVTKDN